MELGGKHAMLVLDDADVDKAVTGARDESGHLSDLRATHGLRHGGGFRSAPSRLNPCEARIFPVGQKPHFTQMAYGRAYGSPVHPHAA